MWKVGIGGRSKEQGVRNTEQRARTICQPSDKSSKIKSFPKSMQKSLEKRSAEVDGKWKMLGERVGSQAAAENCTYTCTSILVCVSMFCEL